MNRLIRSFLTAACLLGAAAGALAQPLTLPLEFRQGDTRFNYQSQGGAPIGTNNDSGSGLLPTTNQFSGFISFGGIPGLAQSDWLVSSNSPLLRGSNAFNGVVAVAMKLPVGYSNVVADASQVVIIMRGGQIGAPYLNRSVSFPFGSIVDVPVTDERGISLTNLASSYWLPKPYQFTSTGQTNATYYWSPHARKVYASQAGPVSITWMKAAYTNGLPPDYITGGVTNYYENGGNYFRLFTVNYIVSGSAVKTPKTLYWTENSFRSLGKPVA